jgi:glycosyltransferase involved in cell wall biosynthesis
MHILWLGSIFDEKTMLHSPAVSPAANRWQSGLIRGLRESGCDVQPLGHRPEPAWPKGAFRIPGASGDAPMADGAPQTHQHLSGYLNVYGLRDVILGVQYVRGLHRMIRCDQRPQCVLCYNVYPHSYAAGREAMRCGIPWFPVIADAPGAPAAYHKLEEKLRKAAGCIFLSWHAFENWPGGPKLHIDGGVSALPDPDVVTPDTHDVKIVFYSGVLNQYGGVELLLDAFAAIRNPDVRLWICGKGNNPKLNDALKRDDRIVFYGCVDEQTLQRLSRQAWVMVNPRPNSVVDSRHNFPSKILEYLSYGKPVISTWTPGIAPEYRSVLIIPDAETPEGLAHAIDNVLQWTASQCRERSLMIRRFLESGKTWRIQADRLNMWICQQVLRQK